MEICQAQNPTDDVRALRTGPLRKEPDLPSHLVFACIEPAIRRAFPTSIESALA